MLFNIIAQKIAPAITSFVINIKEEIKRTRKIQLSSRGTIWPVISTLQKLSRKPKMTQRAGWVKIYTSPTPR